MRRVLALELAMLLIVFPIHVMQSVGGKSGAGGNAGMGGGSSVAGPTWTLKNAQFAVSNGANFPNVSAPAFTNALTNPSLILCVEQDTIAGGVFSGCTDTAGNTYTDTGCGAVLFNTSTVQNHIYYALNTSTTASNVVEANYSSLVSNPRVIGAEFSTGGGTAAVDVTPKTLANQTNGTTGANVLVITSQTTLSNGDLIIAQYGSVAANTTAGTIPNAFTLLTTASGGNMGEYFVQSAAGAIGPTAGDTATDTWGGCAVAFK
jgi:hypothetical protein